MVNICDLCRHARLDSFRRLGKHIQGRYGHNASQRDRTRLPEVSHHWPISIREKNVGRLHVKMDIASQMDMSESSKHSLRYSLDLAQLKRAIPNTVVE